MRSLMNVSEIMLSSSLIGQSLSTIFISHYRTDFSEFFNCVRDQQLTCFCLYFAISEMSTQRKFNYSFRSRNRNITEPKESEQNKTEASPMNSKTSESKPEEIKTSPGPSFPSDCEPEPLGCQKLPDPDQPISAADLEHRKSAIRGAY